MKHLCCVLLLVFALSSCKKGKALPEVNEGAAVTVIGTVQVLQASCFMYGTHTITNIDQYFALKSSTINLNDYNGKNVVLTGNKITGYPVDGGPEFIEVKSVKVQ
jgi:hypothetical protein